MQNNDNSLEIPENMKDLFTGEIMNDPVRAADGQNYERSFIQRWFNLGFYKSPTTGELLLNQDLKFNAELKKEIDDYLKIHPEAARRPINNEELEKLVEQRYQMVQETINIIATTATAAVATEITATSCCIL